MNTTQQAASRLPTDTYAGWRWQKLLLTLYIVYVALSTLYEGAPLPSRHIEWQTEDWLINYHGGFIRRGLFGQVALGLSHLSHLQAWWFVFALQALCYLSILIASYALLVDHQRREWSPWTWALILSPATLAFQVVDHVGGFRKEILFLAGLSALLLMLQRRVSDWIIVAFLSVWLPFTVLTHESLFFYMGYYAAALLLDRSFPEGARLKAAHEDGGVAGVEFAGRFDHNRAAWIRAARMLVLPYGLAAVAMVAVCTHPGTARMASEVCSAIGGRQLDSCGGAIKSLAQTRPEAHQVLVAEMKKNSYPLIYGIDGALALLPIAVMLRAAFVSPRFRRAASILSLTVCSAFLLSLPLYYYAIDWGRWIYIQVLALTLLLFSAEWEHHGLELPWSTVFRRRGPAGAIALFAVLLYACAWTLPHFPGFRQRFGYLQRIAGERHKAPAARPNAIRGL